mmetsp:Transcript_17861/g.17936  ORF Transcript_17861/g.17936 Transcript_17861/m.17936 type:complete len:140 (+) Transcript_17861:276-695(+)
MMATVFVYGSLMAAEVRTMVMGRSATTIPAQLTDYHRYKVKNEVFPAILPKPGSNIDGMIMTDVQESEMPFLDAFEDGYNRVDIKVRVSNPERLVEAMAYVWSDDPALLYGTWSFEQDFLPNMQSFLQENYEQYSFKQR